MAIATSSLVSCVNGIERPTPSGATSGELVTDTIAKKPMGDVINPSLVRLVGYEVCSTPGSMMGANPSGCLEVEFLKARLLWQPIGEGRMYHAEDFQTVEDNASGSDFRLVVRSRGCFPDSAVPQAEEFYQIPSAILIRSQVSTMTVNLKTAPVTNQQVEELRHASVSQVMPLEPGKKAHCQSVEIESNRK
jgi:hypothetical protein